MSKTELRRLELKASIAMHARVEGLALREKDIARFRTHRTLRNTLEAELTALSFT